MIRSIRLSFFFAVLCLVAALPVFSRPRPDAAYDYIIRHAVVFDGKNSEPQKIDVAIRDGRIAALGDLSAQSARETIEAKGLVLAPGFIDAHTHSDFNPLIYPSLENKILQGVTTEVVGNCGMSAAPVIGSHQERIHGIWAREGIRIPEPVPWSTVEEYKKNLKTAGLFTNFVVLVGHGNLRSGVVGFAPRPASDGEIAEMKKILHESMLQGARGISFGLIYVPGMFADHREITELCRQAAMDGGVCTFHMRSEGTRLIEAVEEVISVAREAQARVQISHLKAGGSSNWMKIDPVFKLIEEARLEGLHIQSDAYPYTAGFIELGVVLPDDLYERDDRVGYFRDPARREALLRKLRKFYESKNMKWEGVIIAATPGGRWQRYEGKSIRDIARADNVEPETFLVSLLADTGFEVTAFTLGQSEEVVDKVITRPYVSVGSDSSADGIRRPHPRAYGTFPRVIASYVRERNLLPLAEAIRKMTSLPAEQFALKDRGEIRTGFSADLVLFDAGEISDRATYEKPTLPSKGVRWVFVNGVPAMKNGKLTGRKTGEIVVPAA